MEKIAVDFDDVITDSRQLKSFAGKDFFGVDIPASQFKKDLVIGQGLLTKEQYGKLQEVIYENREIGLLLEPMESAVFYLSKLKKDGYQIKVVTSRSGIGLEIAKEWTKKQGLSLDFIGVGYGNSKVPALQGFQVFVDDDIDKLMSVVGVVPHLFLFSGDFNHYPEKNCTFPRISSWAELYAIVKTLS